ncbi:MAG: DUF4158 domain-containing protein [Mycobacteriaceae bacterium]
MTRTAPRSGTAAWCAPGWGVTYDPVKVREVAEAALRETAQGKDNPADLINAALEQLVKASCELPGYTTLDAMASTVRTEVNNALFTMVAGRLDTAARARMLGLLAVDPVRRRSDFERIKDPPGAATISGLRMWLEHLGWLDGLGPTEQWLEGISPTKIGHFAGEARVLDAAELRDVGEDKPLALVTCLVHTVRVSACDDAVEMFCKRMAALHRKARDRLEQLREQHRVESERLLGVSGDVLTVVRDALAPSEGEVEEGASDPIGEVSERAGRQVIKTLAEAGGVAALSGAHEGCRRTTSTTTPRLSPCFAAPTGRRCSTCSTPWTFSPPAPTTRSPTRSPSSRPTGTAPANSSPIIATAGRWTCRSPGRCGRRSCGTSSGQDGWCPDTSRSACSPRRGACVPATLRWPARTPTPTCTPS